MLSEVIKIRSSIPTSLHNFRLHEAATPPIAAAIFIIYIHGTRELTLSHIVSLPQISPHTKSLTHNGYIPKTTHHLFLCLTHLFIY